MIGDKRELRAHMRRVLADLDHTTRASASASACERALEWPPLAACSVVLAYAPMPAELDISPLIDALLARSARVGIPRVDWRAGSMAPVEVRSLETDLLTGPRGVREPRPELPEIPVAHLQVIVTPGLAFDVHGGRIGRAGGFYDRFLARLPASTRVIGIGFDEQVVPRVPMEPHDAAVHAVATPTRLIECARSREDRS